MAGLAPTPTLALSGSMFPHETLCPGDPCPLCPKGKVYPIRTPRRADPHHRSGTVQGMALRAGSATLQPVWRGLHGQATAGRWRGKV